MFPIGVASALCRCFICRRDKRSRAAASRCRRAVAVTTSLMLAVYAIVNGNAAGWGSEPDDWHTRCSRCSWHPLPCHRDARARALMPLRLFSSRNVAISNIVGVLWPRRCSRGSSFRRSICSWCSVTRRSRSASLSCPPTSSWGVLAGAFGQDRHPLRPPGAARVGSRSRRSASALCARAGRGEFHARRAAGHDPLGIGAGIAFNPVLLAAMSDVAPSESGLASGVVNTAFMMGGALGLAILASLADGRIAGNIATGSDHRTALAGGYDEAFSSARSSRLWPQHSVFAARKRAHRYRAGLDRTTPATARSGWAR